MKTTSIHKVYFLFALGLLMSCTDLTELNRSGLGEDVFPSSSNLDSYQALVLRPVGHFRNFIANQRFWIILEASTDECVVPTRGGGWGDANRWRDMHFHEWNVNHPTFNQAWNFSYEGINQCNNIVKTLEAAPEFEEKNSFIAQTRAMRAFYYFWLMDAFGNVPLLTATSIEELPNGELPGNNARAEVYDFVVSELEAIENELPDINDVTTYGLPTKWFGLALQAKVKMNAEVYRGSPDYEGTIAACDKIINSGQFAYSDYREMFDVGNGPQVEEIIFAMVNDAQQGSQLNFAVRFIPSSTKDAFNIPRGTWGGHSTLPEFLNKFDDPNDVRNGQWQFGPQFLPSGDPIVDGNGNQIVVDPDLPWGEANDANPFDVGSDLFGANSVKYTPDPTVAGCCGYQDNDYIIFRYADIVLMRGEALAKQGGDPNLGLRDVNDLRQARGAEPFASLTLDLILDERGREFAFEHWRRNDLIRFGKWEDSWGLKTNSDPTRRLFPIPQAQIDANPRLQQNPGY
ncbi:MAG: RagB/SusD family nutrient uptake outer membrane protein [Bacteroidota bacterium]